MGNDTNIIRKLLRIPRRINILLHRIRVLHISMQFASVGERFYIGKNSSILGGEYIHIGSNFSAGPRLRIEAYDRYRDGRFEPSIKIGNNVSINFDCHIGATNSIYIGNDVMIASKVYISDHSHGEINMKSLMIPPRLRPLVSKGPIIIEDNVWIGEGVAILPNVRIGKNSIIGANAVVTKDIPPFSIAAGVPAKIVKIVTH